MVEHDHTAEQERMYLTTQDRLQWDATAVKVVALYFAVTFFSIMALLIIVALTATSSQPSGLWPFS